MLMSIPQGDQFFWGFRVTKLGAGIKIDSLSAADLSAAFKKATTDRMMKEKAEKIGVKIRGEDGPEAAIQFMYVILSPKVYAAASLTLAP